MATWIFQGNPDTFDLDGYLGVEPVITWTVRQKYLANKISVGDRVFIWRAQGNGKKPAGVIAAGHILEASHARPEHAAALPFWRTPPAGDAPRVLIEIDRHATNAKELVKREWLKDDPLLSGLRILKLANETNYAIEAQHASRLEALWRNTGRDWNEAESIAGLWAYTRTMAGEVSRRPGSPIADVALRIGRAVTGVYNKVMNFRHLDPDDTRAGLSGAGETDRKVWAAFYDADRHHLDVVRLEAEHARLWGSTGDPVTNETATFADEIDRTDDAGLPTQAERGRRGQGYEADPRVRREIEVHAMKLAKARYQKQGFVVEDTSATASYDLRCTRDGAEVRVEVKGTRGDGSTVEVTVDEVNNARSTGWRTDLFVVSAIVVSRNDDTVSAIGGTIHIFEAWLPSDEDLRAVRFRCTVPLNPTVT